MSGTRRRGPGATATLAIRRGVAAVAALAIRRGVAAVAALAILSTTETAEAGTALRFEGNGVGDIDRVKVPIDDPATSLPGPPADVGGTDFTIELWIRGAAAENPAPTVPCGDNINWIYGNIVLDRDRYNQDRKFGLSIAGGTLVFGVSGAVLSGCISETACEAPYGRMSA